MLGIILGDEDMKMSKSLHELCPVDHTALQENR